MIGWKAVAGRLSSAGRWLAGWFWQTLAIVAVLALAFVSFRPFSEPRDPDAEDVAAAWNASIQRLGIFPVYPPAEDFYVGDLWAVIVDNDPAGKQHPYLSTLVGQSARIGYIDLHQEMLAARQRQWQPFFSETVEKKQIGFRKEIPAEVDNAVAADRIMITLTAFPGITITHRTRGTAALDRGVLGLDVGREDQRVEEIRIPVAESYGAPAGAAFVRLDQWCKDPKTAIYCTDQYLRRLIAFSVNGKVLAVENGKYSAHIQLRLVTRVFLTREIQHRHSIVGAAGVSGQAGTVRPVERPKDDAPAASAPGGLEQRVGDALKAAGQAADASAPSGVAGAAISFTRGDGTDIDLNEVFQRPVAFGYRALSIDLEPSSPGASP